MKKFHAIVAATCFVASTQVSAEIVILTNAADGADKQAGIAAVKQRLLDACTSRGGTPVADSFEVVAEQTSKNPDVPKPYDVDAKMKCDLPAG